MASLTLAIASMCRPQVSEFTIAPRFAYDDLGAPPLVPPDATLVFEVELVEWENKSDVLGDGRAVAWGMGGMGCRAWGAWEDMEPPWGNTGDAEEVWWMGLRG